MYIFPIKKRRVKKDMPGSHYDSLKNYTMIETNPSPVTAQEFIMIKIVLTSYNIHKEKNIIIEILRES